MAATVPVLVRCRACGPVQVDPALVELHRDRVHRFTIATFLCLGCGQLGASRCPDAVAASREAGASVRELRCSSTPAVPDPPEAPGSRR